MDSKPRSKANLKKYTKVDGKWRFVPVLKQNGVPYPGTVIIDGKPVRSTTGTFYLESYENGRRVQKPVGNSPREAKDAWNRHSNPDRDSASILAEDENAGPALTPIATAFERFLEEAKATKEPATYKAYWKDLDWVAAKLDRQFVSKVTRHDVLRVMGEGRQEGLDPKTINRKMIVALMALRNAGAQIEMKRGDWPKVIESIVEIYDPKELAAFFRACAPREKLLFETFLCTGFRKREIATLTWNDVDFDQRTLRVRRKPEYGFKPKNHEERAVPVPWKLIRSLAARRKTHGESTLIFPTLPHPKRPEYGGQMPDAHHLELCKQIAWQARLNCRHCATAKGRCSQGPYCERWTLHKWRHTFATSSLRSGVDVKSLQVLLGHKNLATTEKYLRSLPPIGLRSKVEKSIVAEILRGK
jgi:integrase/recombinase XerD